MGEVSGSKNSQSDKSSLYISGNKAVKKGVIHPG
jgi:hypothetical protein